MRHFLRRLRVRTRAASGPSPFFLMFMAFTAGLFGSTSLDSIIPLGQNVRLESFIYLIAFLAAVYEARSIRTRFQDMSKFERD